MAGTTTIGDRSRRGWAFSSWRRRATALLSLLVFAAAAGCGSDAPKGGPPAASYRAAPDTLVKDLKVGTAKEYRWIPFHDGYPLFIDRDYFYGTVPQQFAEFPMLLTACDDKNFPAEKPLVSFTAVRPIRVHVLHSAVLYRGAMGKAWLNDLNGWREESWTVGTTMGTATITQRLVRSKAFAAGERVELGGPGCEKESCETYSLVVATEP